MGLGESGQAGALKEIEVTPAMIEAGLDELCQHRVGTDWEVILESVYRAMAYRAPASITSAST